ncbi:ATP-binding protein [Rhodospirillum sp. A1_3_36]|uniref:hybrid sensor histidine kinase/response regulator n=1 Tax=Rhodospirillum sp. A1_3_36 TaxID=3391666 RepID=UPI0039A6673C
MGVKAILIGTLVLLTLAQSLISIGNIQKRRDDLANSHVLISRVNHARILIEATQAIAQERGWTNAMLRTSKADTDKLTSLRAKADAAMAETLLLDTVNDSHALLQIKWNKFVERRAIVDRALAKGEKQVNGHVADNWLSLATDMVKTLDDTLRDTWYLEENISRDGRNLWILLTEAARMRLAAGRDSAQLAGDLIDNRRPDRQTEERNANSQGAIGEIWRDVRRSAEPFPELNGTIQDIDRLYWGDYQALRSEFIQNAPDPTVPLLSEKTFIAAAVPAIQAISRLSIEVGDLLLARAESQVTEARRALAIQCILLGCYVILAVLAIGILHFRLSRPLIAMTDKLTLAQTNTPTKPLVSPEATAFHPPRPHRDEVKRLGQAVDDYISTLAALAKSEERFRLATLAARDGIWDWDFRTGKIWFSSRWKEQLGYTDHEFPNTFEAWERVIFPEDRAAALTLVEDFNAGRAPAFDIIQRFRHRDGHTVHIHSRAIHEKDATGNIVRMVGAHTDITSQVLHEAELREARERAEEANHAKSNFLAVVSHELRTPLTGILGMADMLLASNPGKRQHHWLTVLRNSGTSLLGLVNDILDFSKIEAGSLTLETLNHDPLTIAAEVVESLRPQAQRKGLELTVDFHPLDLRAGDPTKLRQILLNLVGNAVKFTDSGRVSLSVGPSGPSGPSGNQSPIQIEVWDTGIGMTPAQMNRLFTPFTQADDSTTRRHGGTGLGLVISHRLCEAMGGTITCKSQPGEGTRFTVTLPMPLASDTFQSLDPSPTEGLASFGALPSLSLLIAEDNETNRLLLGEALIALGHRPVLVENGALAVEAAEAEPFDAIIMDMQMPVMDGIDAVRLIRQREQKAATEGDAVSRRHLPIVALTANVSAKETLGDEAGLFDAFLTKPINWTMLAATLAALTSVDLPQDGRSVPPASSTAPPSGSKAAQGLPPDWTNQPVFDHGWMEPLATRVSSDKVAAILRSLQGRLTQPIGPLTLAVETDDQETANRLCHALKGMARQFGLARIALLAETLETHAKGGDSEAMGPLLPILSQEVDAAKQAITDKLHLVAVA